MLKSTTIFQGIAIILAVPSVASAHVKWFVDADNIPPDPGLAYRLSDPAVLLWIGVLLAGLVAAYILDRIAPSPPRKLIQKGGDWHERTIYVFQLVIGIALLTTAYKGAILAPHLTDGAGMTLLLRSMEALVGVLLIINRWVKFGAFVLFLLFFASAIIFGLLTSLEYFNLLGIAVFLIFIKSPNNSGFGRNCEWALPLLRFHTGVALSVLAFSEKLLRPELAMAFLEKHGVNFMKNLGFAGFGDHLFVLSAGFSELLFGLIFISGLVTRINTVSIGFMLVASNVYFFVAGKWEEGILEIIGHGNILAIAMIFVFYGAGQKIRLRPSPQSAVNAEEPSSGRIEELVTEDLCEPWCADQRT